MRTNNSRFLAATFAAIFSLVAPLNAAVTNYVTTTADSGPGSLRQAIMDSLSGDVIRFRTNGVITLTSGELSITTNLTIIGPGASLLAISGNNASRVFSISASSITSISGLTIRDGRTTNGASADRSGAFGTSGGSGGGVYNLGTLALNNCFITANRTGNGGSGGDGQPGAWYNCPPSSGGPGGSGGSGGFGGGLYNAGVLTLNTCTLSANVTGNGGGGSRGGLGGFSGCYPSWPGQLGYPGQGGIGGSGGGGGGIWNEQGTVTATNCTFEGNLCGPGGAGKSYTSDYPPELNGAPGVGGGGGGVGNEGTLTLSVCTLSGNASLDVVTDAGIGGGGGGLFNGTNSTATVAACTFSGNLSSNGAGIYNNGFLSVVSSTVANNTAYPGLAGGIYTTFGSCCFTNATLGNTLIAGNFPYDISRSFFVSEGHNMVGLKGGFSGFRANSCNCDFVGTTNRIEPLLGPLQDNGGPVPTHALLADSPAIDSGINNTGEAFDARGQPRTLDDPAVTNAFGGDGTDIGAFEVNHILTSIEVRRSGDDVLVRFTTVSDKTYGVEYRPEVDGDSWTALPGSVAGSGGIVTYMDIGAASVPRRFYRVFERAP